MEELKKDIDTHTHKKKTSKKA